MRKDLAVYGHSGGTLKVVGGDAYLVDSNNCVTWTYHGKDHKGIGIAACARSATSYMHHVLKELGYDVGHEQWGSDGSVGYHLAAIRPDNCFHQVRNPLNQIASMVSHKSWGFCDQMIDLPNFELLGCMYYWLNWNEMIEEFAEWRYQIERLPDVWDEFLVRIGHNQCDLPDVPTDTNKSQRLIHKLTWDDLFAEDRQLTQDIIEMAKRYGYDTPEMDKVEYHNLGELETAQVAPV